jgi:hypothetical protein
MSYNGLEIDILRFLRPRLGTVFTPKEVFEGIEGHPVEEENFNVTLNILIQEGLIEGDVSSTMKNHNVKGISADGLKVLRREFGTLERDNFSK